MLKEKNYLFSRLNQLLDFLLIVAAFFAALWTRNALLVPNFFPHEPIIHVREHHWLIWIMGPLIILTQMTLGVYNSQRMSSASRLFARIVLSVLAAAVLTTGIVVALGILAGTGLGVISKPQIFYFALWVTLLLMWKATLVKRFFLPCAGVASTPGTCSWPAVALS
jgi:hypothetical protein